MNVAHSKVLAIDIGGTGSRARLGQAEVFGPGVRIGAEGIPLGAILDTLVAGLPADHIDTVSVGTSGLLGLTAPDAALGEVRKRWPRARIVLSSDAVTAAAAALEGEGGVAISVGTGVVGLATNFRDVWRRADGWGHLLGDEGGGAWIGARGLRAALHAHDGRAGGSAALLAEATAQFGHPEGLPWHIYTRADRAGVLASFVPAVARAATAHDPVARRIGADAADAVVETAVALLNEPVPQRLAFTGGLLNAHELFVRPLLERLSERLPSVNVCLTEARPLDGAEILGHAQKLPEGGRSPFLTIDTPYRNPTSSQAARYASREVHEEDL